MSSISSIITSSFPASYQHTFLHLNNNNNNNNSLLLHTRRRVFYDHASPHHHSVSINNFASTKRCRFIAAHSSILHLPLLPFPLNQVFVPCEAKTLHLYEARYLALLDECLIKKRKQFVHFVLDPMALSETSTEVSFAARYGCLVMIEKVERVDVGALVSIRGIGRVKIVQFEQVSGIVVYITYSKKGGQSLLGLRKKLERKKKKTQSFEMELLANCLVGENLDGLTELDDLDELFSFVQNKIQLVNDKIATFQHMNTSIVPMEEDIGNGS